MRSVICDPHSAIGALTRANISDAAGHRIVAKGRRLDAHDALRLSAAGITAVAVVFLEPGELDENQAAHALACTVAGPGTEPRAAHHGRADIHATTNGVLVIDIAALMEANARPEVTLATVRDGTVIRSGSRVASAKILPLAIASEYMPTNAAPVVTVAPFIRTRVGVLVVGAVATHLRIQHAQLPALHERLARWDAAIITVQTSIPDPDEVARAFVALTPTVDIVVTLSDSSLKSIADPLPTGIRSAGGQIIRHGAPVEPGNLMLLATLGGVPVLAAPGCVRQPARNLVDMLLPRLVADMIPTSTEIAGWAHGGLLGEDHD